VFHSFKSFALFIVPGWLPFNLLPAVFTYWLSVYVPFWPACFFPAGYHFYAPLELLRCLFIPVWLPVIWA
jgi:hypothetical protein